MRLERVDCIYEIFADDAVAVLHQTAQDPTANSIGSPPTRCAPTPVGASTWSIAPSPPNSAKSTRWGSSLVDEPTVGPRAGHSRNTSLA